MHNISIKVEGIERRKKSTGLFHIIAGLFLIANAGQFLKQKEYHDFWSLIPVFIVALASVGYGLMRGKIDPSASYNHWMRMLQFLMFAVLGIFILNGAVDFRVMSLFLWAVVSVLLLFTERKVFHDAYLSFTENNIIIPGYFSNRTIFWSEIETVVVRPDYVTIHFPGNKYQQYEVLNHIDKQTIDKINLFCKNKIAGKEIVH